MTQNDLKDIENRIDIRPLRETDCDKLCSLLFDEWTEDYVEFTEWKTKELLSEYYKSVISSESTDIPFCFVCVEKTTGQLLGAVVFANEDMKMRPDLSPWLCALFVVPEYRKMGIARLLVEHGMEHCRNNLKLSTVYLWTFDEPLANYYKTFGFETIECVDHGHRQMAIVMQKQLY